MRLVRFSVLVEGGVEDVAVGIADLVFTPALDHVGRAPFPATQFCPLINWGAALRAASDDHKTAP